MEAFAFVDVGAAWTDDEPVEWTFERDTVERVPVASAGVGLRVLIGGPLPLQLYIAEPYQRPREGRTTGITISTGW